MTTNNFSVKITVLKIREEITLLFGSFYTPCLGPLVCNERKALKGRSCGGCGLERNRIYWKRNQHVPICLSDQAQPARQASGIGRMGNRFIHFTFGEHMFGVR